MLDFFTVRATRLATSVRALLVQVFGVGAEGDTDSEQLDDVEVLQPIGVFVRPGSGTTPEAVCVRIGEEVVCIGLVDKTLSIFTDVEEGESRYYGAKEPTARLRLRNNGDVQLEAKSGQVVTVDAVSGTVKLGATATKKVNREGDPIDPGTASIAVVNVSGTPNNTVTFTITYTPPGAAPQLLVFAVAAPGAVGTVGPGTSLALAGKTGVGSSKVRAED